MLGEVRQSSCVYTGSWRESVPLSLTATLLPEFLSLIPHITVGNRAESSPCYFPVSKLGAVWELWVQSEGRLSPELSSPRGRVPLLSVWQCQGRVTSSPGPGGERASNTVVILSQHRGRRELQNKPHQNPMQFLFPSFLARFSRTFQTIRGWGG